MSWRQPGLPGTQEPSGYTPPYSVSPAEAALLAELAAGKNVLELGAHKGLSTRALLSTAEHVTSVDTFMETDEDVLSDFMRATFAARANGHLTVIVGLTADVLPMLKLRQFDFIFHDAAHDYETCLADLERLSWQGSTLAVHDYGNIDGVKQACDAIELVPVQQVERLAVFQL